MEAKPLEVEGSDSEQDDGAYDGGSGPARERPHLWVYKACAHSFPMVSWMANLLSNDKTFVEIPDNRLTKAFDKDAEFKNCLRSGGRHVGVPVLLRKLPRRGVRQPHGPREAPPGANIEADGDDLTRHEDAASAH